MLLTTRRTSRRSSITLLRGSLAVLLLVLAAGCGDARQRAMLKQANQALASGNPEAAATTTKQVLKINPRNVLAIRMLRKVKRELYSRAATDVEKKSWNPALKKLQTLLELDPDSAKAQALRKTAQKNKHLEDAQRSRKEHQLGSALEYVRRALKVDANFSEAIAFRDDMLDERDVEVKRLLAQAPTLLQENKPEQVVAEMEEVIKLDSSNQEAKEILREATAAVLAKQKKENLEAARQYYEEARYEAAIEHAQAVLDADSTNFEAKSLLEKATAELHRPEIYVTGISIIRNIPTAAIEIPSLSERSMVRIDDEVGPYRVVDIQPSRKTVTFEFVPTGAMLAYTVARE